MEGAENGLFAAAIVWHPNLKNFSKLGTLILTKRKISTIIIMKIREGAPSLSGVLREVNIMTAKLFKNTNYLGEIAFPEDYDTGVVISTIIALHENLNGEETDRYKIVLMTNPETIYFCKCYAFTEWFLRVSRPWGDEEIAKFKMESM